MRDLSIAAAAELLLQGEGHGQREQRQRHADGVACGQDAEEHVGDEEQEVVEDVGQRGANEDGQRDNARLLVRVHVSGVVAVEDGLRVQRQRDGVHQRQHRQVAHLGRVGKQDGQRAEGDEDDYVSQGHVLETDTCRWKKQWKKLQFSLFS